MNEELKNFYNDRKLNISKQENSPDLKKLGVDFIKKVEETKYSYNFSWMGSPIIAYPQDMIAMQELIWEIKPDLIIETGVAHGGSIIYYASLLNMIGNGTVLGIDIDIRSHNRKLIESHPMFNRIELIEGSSTSNQVYEVVKKMAESKKKILVCLDSNHTHDHVLKELELYAPLVSKDSYCVVFDTVVEDMGPDWDWGIRDWGVGNNPKTAVYEYLKQNKDFKIDSSIDSKLLVTVAPSGYLKKIK
jgi:cephalosporin hydroxylase